ncbi:MAG: response regulator transcription factor [Propionibacteriaceae bacterium]
MNAQLTVALCDDSGIFRQGLAMLLGAAGISVMASVASGDELLATLPRALPDAVIVDVRMPPTHTDEGIRLAAKLRGDYPDLGILVLSTYVEPIWAMRLLESVPTGVGYFLKDRVSDAGTLVDGLNRVAAGSAALEPLVVSAMMGAARQSDPLTRLSEQERRVLALLAEGHSNEAIAQRVHVSERTVESHVAAIFRSLGLAPDAAMNRRVQAAVAFLESNRHQSR